MGNRSFDEGRIKSAEVVQLITLYNLFSKKQSKSIIFQGGMALRWFYGNDRFSEDLGFVTSLDLKDVVSILQAVRPGIEADIKAQFGPGVFAFKLKEKGRDESQTAFIEYFPEKQRGKTMVKLEFEKLRDGAFPGEDQVILSSAPAVSYFIRTGAVMIPSGRVINVETAREILSDKLRALMERNFLKGRDLYDVWHMTRTLGTVPDVLSLKMKLEMYEHSFTLTRGPEYFLGLARGADSDDTAKVRDVIDKDLSRFVNEDAMNVLRRQGFQPILEAAGEAFGVLLKNGLDLTDYQTTKDAPAGPAR